LGQSVNLFVPIDLQFVPIGLTICPNKSRNYMKLKEKFSP